MLLSLFLSMTMALPAAGRPPPCPPATGASAPAPPAAPAGAPVSPGIATVAAPGATPPAGALLAAPPASPARLGGIRGGASGGTHIDGSVSANTAINVSTGSNIIDGGSFAGMAGVPLVVQNSGANVLIQNATTINLQVH